MSYLLRRVSPSRHRPHVAQMQLREIRPVLALVTAEHVGHSQTTPEPSPWLTVTAACVSTPNPAAPPPPSAAGTGATELR
jgi:hypothetical protein